MSAPEGKNIYIDLLKVCLAHSLLQNEKQKIGKVFFVKHFNWKLTRKESCLYLWVPARTKFTGAVSWQPPRAKNVRRMGPQGPLICEQSLPGQMRGETILEQKHNCFCAGSNQNECMWKSHQGLLFNLLIHILPLQLPKLPKTLVHCIL